MNCQQIFGVLAILFSAVTVRLQDQDVVDPMEWSGFGAAEAQSFIDHPHLTPEDNRLFRLFYRVQKIPERHWDALTGEELDMRELISRADRFQFRPIRIRGHLKEVKKISSPKTYADDIPAYFSCQIQDESGNIAVVNSLHVPSQLIRLSNLDEPVEFSGFFLGSLKSGNLTVPVPHLVGKQFEWYPATHHELDLDSGQMELAKAGFNLSYLDTINRFNRLPLRAEENAAFYAMLDAVRRLAPQNSIAFESPFPARKNLFDLIRSPLDQAGVAVELQGRIVKISPVYSESASPPGEDRSPQFYQIQVAVPIGSTQIKVDFGNNDSLVFRDRFPVTVVIPANKLASDLEEHQQLHIVGFLYRFWSYQSELSKANQVEAGQCCPLVMSHRISVVDSQRISSDLVPFLITAGLFGSGGLAWYFWPRKKARKPVESKPFNWPPASES